MLSRVAESLFWMSRYIERAEDLARLLAVNFHAALDAGDPEAPETWEPLVSYCGDTATFRSEYGEFTGPAVSEFILWNPQNVNSVYACVLRARENARSVREKISSEMWESINRLYFLMKDYDRSASNRAPQDLYLQVSSGSHLFQGVSNSTLTHGEPYEFVQLGKYIERTEWTIRNLDLNSPGLSQLKTVSSDGTLQLTSVLTAGNAFEPFRQSGAPLQSWRVAEFLLLNRIFPRSVAYSVDRCHRAVGAITTWGYENPRLENMPARVFGRLNAELQFLELDDVLGRTFNRYLQHLLQEINIAGEEISRTYFNTQATVPGAKLVQMNDQ